MFKPGDEVTLVVNGNGIRAKVIAARGTLLMLDFDGCVKLDGHSTAVLALIARYVDNGWQELVTHTPVHILTRAEA